MGKVILSVRELIVDGENVYPLNTTGEELDNILKDKLKEQEPLKVVLKVFEENGQVVGLDEVKYRRIKVDLEGNIETKDSLNKEDVTVKSVMNWIVDGPKKEELIALKRYVSEHYPKIIPRTREK